VEEMLKFDTSVSRGTQSRVSRAALFDQEAAGIDVFNGGES